MNVKNGLELCKNHRQETNQSHFDKHNCDFCKLEAEVERLRDELAEAKAAESPPSPSRCYATEVKEAVGRLLDLAARRKWNTLTIDTDEDCPSVNLWVPPNAIRVYGHPLEGWIGPSEGDEHWSFLECCQRALAEAEKLE